MLPLKIFTLGGLSILRGDQPVSGFISRKVEALLVYVAFDRREHLRELLAELLWDDASQARAMGNLRSALSNLQSLLPDHVMITRQTVMINPASECWLDALEVSKTLKKPEASLTPATIHQLENTLELYKGDFLAGFHLRDGQNFQSWRSLEAERLRGQVIEGLLRLSHDSLERGSYPVGIDQARRLVAIDPLSEEAHRCMMLLLARSGQRGAALAQYEACVRLLREELDVAPEPQTTRLYAQIQTEQVTSSVEKNKPVIRLPIPPTPFIERPSELKQIADRLNNPDCHLLTIVGVGEIGKTRLALQAATIRADDYRDGVYFIPLASVQSGDFLPVEMANILRYTFQGTENLREELIHYLATRETLLILDNFEYLVDSADLLSDILSRAPHVRILVTSRVWLNLREEWILPIDGMAYPSTVSLNAINYDAVKLFVACAQRVRPRFSLESELESVVRICQLVEGMPLCIELAATWLRVIPASEVAQQISVKFLATALRNVPERHRSVEAVFDYSWKLLAADEADALMKLSTFQGAFDRAAAAQVAGATIPILASLVEKSQIRLVDDQYYDMHELLRQYTFERLTTAGLAAATRDAHLRYYVALTSDPDSRIHGQQQTRWLDRLEHEHDNLRTAISWSLDKNTQDKCEAGLTLGASIWEFWLMRGHITEGRQWLDRLLAATNGTVSQARGAATQGAGYLAWIQGEPDRAEALHNEGLAIRTAINDKAGMGGSLSNLGVIAWSRGDFKAARTYYEKALAVRREAGYKLGMASVLNNLLLLLQDQGEYDDALVYAHEAWSIFKEIDDLQGMVHVLFNIGAMTHDRGDMEEARKLQDEALVLARQLGDQRVTGALLQNQGLTLIELGEYALAHTYLEEGLALVTQVGDRQHIALVMKNKARLALLEGRMDDAETSITQSLALLRELKVELYLSQALLVRGDIQWTCGDLPLAESTYREALSMLLKINNQQTIAIAIYCLGGLAFEQHDPFRAVVMLSLADTIAERLNLRFPARPERIDRELVRASLPPTEFERAVTMGSTMDLAALSEQLGLATS